MPDNFAVLHVCPFIKEDGYIIECWTDVACHLWLRYTANKPVQHMEAKLRRGLPITYLPRFCFTGWQQIEQDEEGDTTHHSFNLHPIYWMSHVYFYLVGQIAGVDSPSTSPIMDYPLDVKKAQALQSQQGYEASGQAISHNSAKAMSFPPFTTMRLAGLNLYIYGFDPKYKFSVHIYATDDQKRPEGAPLASTYFAHVPYKRIFPKIDFFFVPFPRLLLYQDVFYSIAIFGDPDYPAENVVWWSRWPAPGGYPGQVSWRRTWTGLEWLWIKDTVNVNQYQLWVNVKGADPCPSFPPNITP